MPITRTRDHAECTGLEWVFLDGRCYVADVKDRDMYDRPLLADLYLNPTNFRIGRVLHRDVELRPA